MLSVGVKPAMSASCASKACTSDPIATPRFVLAPDALVLPVPPSETARVPVIELAPKSTAISADSITTPPFAFKSTEIVLPVFCNPSAVVI